MPLKFKLIETNFVQAEKFCLNVELEKNWKLSFLSRKSEIRIRTSACGPKADISVIEVLFILLLLILFPFYVLYSVISVFKVMHAFLLSGSPSR